MMGMVITAIVTALVSVVPLVTELQGAVGRILPGIAQPIGCEPLALEGVTILDAAKKVDRMGVGGQSGYFLGRQVSTEMYAFGEGSSHRDIAFADPDYVGNRQHSLFRYGAHFQASHMVDLISWGRSAVSHDHINRWMAGMLWGWRVSGVPVNQVGSVQEQVSPKLAVDRPATISNGPEGRAQGEKQDQRLNPGIGDLVLGEPDSSAGKAQLFLWIAFRVILTAGGVLGVLWGYASLIDAHRWRGRFLACAAIGGSLLALYVSSPYLWLGL
jgi:hypothetical protein